MKKFFLLSITAILFIASSVAQNVGIGTTTPNGSAALEIKATGKGLLIPRTSTASRTAIVNPAKGLMVYDTTNNSFWFHNDSAWVQIGSAGNGWSVTGNSGTTSVNDFIGTTDAQPLVFKVNDQKAGLLDYDIATANTGFGYKTLSANTGIYNTANGYQALHSNTSGVGNTAIGRYALYYDTTGSYNTATGMNALISNTTGSSNTAYGVYALSLNITGVGNTANGGSALNANQTGSSNTANGIDALTSNNGDANTANGASALYQNTTGSFNTANGTQALHDNSTGNTNTADGYLSLLENQTGYSNTAIGADALSSNISGSNLVAIGDSALYNQNGGFGNNIAIGSKALYSNTTGSNNTANGYQSLYSNTTGDENTANGTYTLSYNTTGNHNTACGGDALFSNITGYENTANGYAALAFNTTGFYNTANGYAALQGNTIGRGNTANGYAALADNTTGLYNTAYGAEAGVTSADLTNATAIGANAKVSISNALVLGNNAYVGIGTSAPNAPLHIAQGFSSGITAASQNRVYFFLGSGTSLISNTSTSGNIMVQADGWYWANGGGFVATSDARIKNIIGITDNEHDLETISKIQVTDYKYIDEINNGDMMQKKVVAQQLKEVYPTAVRQNEGIIPNVYEVAESVMISGQITIIKTRKPHDFITGDMVKLIVDKEGEKMLRVIVIDPNTFSVAEKVTGDVFVYGKKVKDLLNVDYDALSMLNVSATQELIKKVDALEKENAVLKQKTDEMQVLKAELDKQEKMIEQLEKKYTK